MSKPLAHLPRIRHAIEYTFFDADVEVLLDPDPQAIAAAQTPLLRRIITTMEPQKEAVSPVLITCHAELPSGSGQTEEQRLFEVASLTIFSWFIDNGIEDLNLVSVFQRIRHSASGSPGVALPRTDEARVLLAGVYALETADPTMFNLPD